MDDEQFPSGCRGVCSLSWVLCRVCFLVRAFLCALSCARRAGGVRGLLVACWGCAKKFALLGKNGRFSVFLGLLGEFFRAGRRMGARRANFVAVWAGWDNAGAFMCACRAGDARGLVVACWICAKKFALRGEADWEARKSSPCSAKMADFRCFWACWASFFAVLPK